jgi:cob(I)alamin adenosyltransferase
MAKIYTKTGDKGETSLVGGQRVKKYHDRIHLYGEVDELNSFLGLLISNLEGAQYELQESLTFIQRELFELGSNLATVVSDQEKFNLKPINEKTVKFLEDKIDQYQKDLKPLKNFILPGGSKASSQAHICRTVTRRVERKMVEFYQNENITEGMNIIFLNRLSDYFFILARQLNQLLKIDDIIWEKRKE